MNGPGRLLASADIAANLRRLRGMTLRSELESAPQSLIPPSTSPDLNVVPLVDVLFLLMIFFIIAGAFLRNEGLLSTKLPPAGLSGSATPLPFSAVMVELRCDAADLRKVNIHLSGSQEPIGGFDQLVQALRGMKSTFGLDPSVVLIIKADDPVPWDVVAAGWNSAVRAGFSRVAFSPGRGGLLPVPVGN